MSPILSFNLQKPIYTSLYSMNTILGKLYTIIEKRYWTAFEKINFFNTKNKKL